MRGNRGVATVGCGLAAALVFALLPPAATGAARDARPIGARHAATARQAVPGLDAMLREMRAWRVERSIRRLAAFGTRHTLSSQDDPRRGIGAARDWIRRQFERYAATSGGRMTVELQSYVQEPAPRVPTPTRITNVVATLRGTQPESADRMYVVSGHYDSRCSDVLDAACDAPGADDDASGVAAVLEMARVMAKRPFDATVVFMAVAGEEQGLLGSTFYAEQARQQNRNIAGMFTNDIVGSSLGGNGVRDRRTVRLFAEGPPADETPEEAAIRRVMGGENDSPPRQLARFVKGIAEAHTGMRVRIVYRRDRFLRGGDHLPFLARRYPAVRFTEPNEDYRHQHQDVRVEDGVRFGDLPEFVDFAYTMRVARVNAAALWGLANGPAAPRDVRVLAGELSNDTDLVWEPNREPDLAGYEIVYRDTTAPLWTHTIRVGNVTSHKVRGITKDDFHFGVRAVDRDGNRSVVAFPRPQS